MDSNNGLVAYAVSTVNSINWADYKSVDEVKVLKGIVFDMIGSVMSELPDGEHITQLDQLYIEFNEKADFFIDQLTDADEDKSLTPKHFVAWLAYMGAISFIKNSDLQLLTAHEQPIFDGLVAAGVQQERVVEVQTLFVERINALQKGVVLSKTLNDRPTVSAKKLTPVKQPSYVDAIADILKR